MTTTSTQAAGWPAAIPTRECEHPGCGLTLPLAIMARMEHGEWYCPVDDPTGTAWPGHSEHYRALAQERGEDYARAAVLDGAQKLTDLRVIGEPGVGVYTESGGARRALPPRYDLAMHSPTGYSWGYGGSGPAQLALALASLVVGGRADLALSCYQRLKWDLIARLPFAQPWSRSYWSLVEAVKRALEVEDASR